MNAEKKRQRNHEKRVMAAAKRRRKEEKKAQRREKNAGGGEKRKNFWKTFVIALGIFLIVLIPVGAAVNRFLDTSPFQGSEEDDFSDVKFEVLVDPESPFFEEFSDSERINILLMGVNPPLTDTLMLGSFDPKSKHVDLISIPRDTYYYRPGYGAAEYAQYKINAAFQKNPMNTAKAVSEILMGIPINYYAVVEYDDIQKIVDTMGGVPMYIEKDMNYDDNWDKPPLHIHLKAGQQVLSGEDSVKFLRYRHGYSEGDIGRVKAQQVWMKNALSQAIDYGILDVAKVAFKEIDSNLTYRAMLSLGTKALGMSAENIATYTMPHTLQGEPPWYVYPDTAGIEEMLRTIYSIEPETEAEDTTSDGAVKSE